MTRNPYVGAFQMIDGLLFALTLGAALGAALVGGVFFAFSSFVMGVLARLPAPQGIAAMRSVNVVVLTPWFMTPFFGTALACVALGVFALIGWGDAGMALRLSGAVVYLVGTIVVTVAANVPRNDALAAVDPTGDDGAAAWARYVPGWTAWNTVRTIASLLAALLMILALVTDPPAFLIDERVPGD